MIRKDVNDALNNLKKSSPNPPEEKHIKSKFDNMSPDELLNAINSSKESNSAPTVKKLKRIPQNTQKKVPETEKNPDKKKRIVIGELPDYDAIMKQEEETPNNNTEPVKKVPEKKSESVSVPKEKVKPEKNRKGFFSRVKDLMYVTEEDDQEIPPETESSANDGNFTIESLDESTLENKSEPIAEVNDKVSGDKTVKENQSETKVENPEPEKISETEKTPKQEKVPEKKQGNNSSSSKKKKKKNNSGNKPDVKQENKTETKSENKKEVKSETKSENKEEVKSETKPENKEEVKSETKNEVKQNKTESKPEIKQEEVKSEEKKSDNSKNTKETKPVKKNNQNISEKQKNPPKTKVAESTKKSKSNKSAVSVKKNNILALICIILAIIGVMAIINYCVSNVGGGKSSKEKFTKAVYPAVIMDINSFNNPSELPNDQILSATIWSIVIDDKKLSKYTERMGVVNIPATDVEKYAVELFGEDIPELTHTTVGPVESKFYYNVEAESYNIQVKPDTFTYSPEVTSVSRENGNYIVDVEYVEEHPEWMEKSVSKSAEFSLSKNNSGGYKINSMKILSENPVE